MEQLDRCRLRSSSINSTDQFTSIHKRVKRARTFKEPVSIGEASRSVLQNAEPLHFKHLIPSDHEHNYWLHWSISSGVSTWTACKQKLVRYFRWSIFFAFFLFSYMKVRGCMVTAGCYEIWKAMIVIFFVCWRMLITLMQCWVIWHMCLVAFIIVMHMDAEIFVFTCMMCIMDLTLVDYTHNVFVQLIMSNISVS